MADAHLPESTKLMLGESGRMPLDDWELGFCKWLAAHPRARKKEQEAIASNLAGTTISSVEIRQLRARKNFQANYHRYRAKIVQRLDEHRETFEAENVGKAIKAHSQAIDWAVEKQDYKAIPALMEPAVKAMYKHVEDVQQKPMIVLNLGGFAQQHLEEPAIEVEYEQLPAGERNDDATD